MSKKFLKWFKVKWYCVIIPALTLIVGYMFRIKSQHNIPDVTRASTNNPNKKEDANEAKNIRNATDDMDDR